MRPSIALTIAASITMTLGGLGCVPTSTVGRARTLPRDHWEVWAAPEAYVVAADDGASARPTGRAGVRYGVTDTLELDADVAPASGSISARVQLVRSPSAERGLDLAIQPGVTWAGADKLAFSTTALLGANLDGHQLVVAARVVHQLRLGVGGQSLPASFVYVGGSIGLALRIDDVVTLLPEVSALTEVHADVGFASNLREALGLTGSLGVLFEVR